MRRLESETVRRNTGRRLSQDEFRTIAKIEGKGIFAASKAEGGDLVAVISTFHSVTLPERVGVLTINGPLDAPHDISVDGVRVKFRNLVSIEVLKKSEK